MRPSELGADEMTAVHFRIGQNVPDRLNNIIWFNKPFGLHNSHST